MRQYLQILTEVIKKTNLKKNQLLARRPWTKQLLFDEVFANAGFTEYKTKSQYTHNKH